MPHRTNQTLASCYDVLEMISDTEFEAILTDGTKRIDGDISWSEDEDHSPAQVFRSAIHSDSGETLHINGWYNPYAGRLSFTVLRQGTGRIYGLDLGVSHGRQNPSGTYAKHKHRWTEARKDKNIYDPPDITASAERPVEVWRQFCVEARIKHEGTLHEPQVQAGLDL